MTHWLDGTVHQAAVHYLLPAVAASVVSVACAAKVPYLSAQIVLWTCNTRYGASRGSCHVGKVLGPSAYGVRGEPEAEVDGRLRGWLGRLGCNG